MKTHVRFLGSLLLAAAAAGAGVAGANPRSAVMNAPPYKAGPPVTDTVEIGGWLRRLAGRYRVTGMAEFRTGDADESAGLLISVEGMADCAGVGAGPGMQCILHITWLDQFQVIQPSTEDPPAGEQTPPAGVYSLPGGDSFLDPSMLLIGLDPASAGIHPLLVDNKGLPEGGIGSLAGPRGSWTTPCVNARVMFQTMNPVLRYDGQRPHTCQRIFRIDARPDSKVLHLAIYIEINGEPQTRFDLTLRRTREDKVAQ